jgi:hypothetical protein
MFYKGWIAAWLTFWTFFALQLSGAWHTSWWWITAPLWGAALGTLVAVLVGGLVAFVAARHIRRSASYQQAKFEARSAVQEFLHSFK